MKFFAVILTVIPMLGLLFHFVLGFAFSEQF